MTPPSRICTRSFTRKMGVQKSTEIDLSELDTYSKVVHAKVSKSKKSSINKLILNDKKDSVNSLDSSCQSFSTLKSPKSQVSSCQISRANRNKKKIKKSILASTYEDPSPSLCPAGQMQSSPCQSFVEKKSKRSSKKDLYVSNKQLKYFSDISNKLCIEKYFSIDSYSASVLWHQNYTSNDCIFPNLIPMQYKKLELYDDYIPKRSASPQFRILSDSGKVSTGPTVLNLFESQHIKSKHNDSFIINAGGPIWGLDWIPQSLFLAVSTHRSMYELHEMHTYQNPQSGSFQIWCISTEENIVPKLCMILCHEFAPVFSLKFCPNNEIIPGVLKERLGVLAFSGCDDMVRIASIPQPNLEHCALQLNINIKLSPFIKERSPANKSFEKYRALCFEWNPRYPHDRIVVGYSDGHFCVFKIDSMLDSSSFHTILPIIDLHVMGSPISDITWFPHSEDVVIPVGFDEQFAMYSLNECRTPIFSFTSHGSSCITAPVNSSVILISNGIKLQYPNCVRLLQLCRRTDLIMNHFDVETSFIESVFSHSGLITNIKSCPYTGFVVASDTDGYVSVCNINRRFLKTRSSPTHESIMYSLGYSSPSFSNLCSTDDSNNYMKLLENEFIFTDYNHLEHGISAQKPIMRLKSSKNIQEHFYYESLSALNPCSINRVALCPTMGHLCWTASGGNLGLLRVHCISRWAEDVARKYFNVSENN